MITEKPRNATVFAKDGLVAVAVLNKSEYRRYIGDTFRQKMDQAIEVLKQYEVFTKLALRRLFSLYYYVKEKHFIRNSTLFKEGDLIDGVYLIVDGEYQKLRQEIPPASKTSASPSSSSVQ